MIVAVNPIMCFYIIDDIIPAYYTHTNSIWVQFIPCLNAWVLLKCYQFIHIMNSPH